MEQLKTKESANNKALSPTFCVLPWLHLATRTWGDITPCCVGEPLGENLNKTDFSTAWNSPSIRKLRRAMLKGKASSVCQRCYDEEKTGIASHRLRSNNHWRAQYSFQSFAEKTDSKGFFKENPVYIDMRLGNKCNLECTMCSPQETVRWESLSQKICKTAKTPALKKYFMGHNLFARVAPSKLWYERETIKKDLYKLIPHLKRLTIAGGEPLLIKEHHVFLDECIKQNEAGHIELHYHTNGTVLSVPLSQDSSSPSPLFEKWRHFKHVMLFVSLDDIQERNRYIRYPSSWRRIERNMEIIDKQTPPNVHSKILCTIQMKNIFYFKEFVTWIMSKNFKKIHACYENLVHTEVLHQPYFLCCQVLPPHVKKIVTQKFESLYKKFPLKTNRFKTIVDFMNGEDKSRFLYIFKDYVSSLDEIRGTDFKKTFPELAHLLNYTGRS